MVPPALSPFCFTFYPLSNVCSTPGTREQEGLHSHPLARPPGWQGPESRRAFIATPQLCRPGRQCRVLNWALSSHLSADTPLPRCLAMLALTLTDGFRAILACVAGPSGVLPPLCSQEIAGTAYLAGLLHSALARIRCQKPRRGSSCPQELQKVRLGTAGGPACHCSWDGRDRSSLQLRRPAVFLGAGKTTRICACQCPLEEGDSGAEDGPEG